MFHRILIPLDGSELAERALPVAAHIARTRDARIVLLQVISELPDIGAFAIPAVVTDPQVIECEESEARDYLRNVAQRQIFSGLHIETRVEFGLPASAILGAVKAYAIDSIVIGSHGRNRVSKWALGSVAQAIVRHASVPVLLLRRRGPALEDLYMPASPARLIVPLDGSAVAEAALEPAQIIGEVLASDGVYDLHLTRIIPFNNSVTADHQRDAAHKAAIAYLESVAQRISAAPGSHARITTSVIFDLDPADAIARMTRASELVVGARNSLGYDLIAMATHGRAGLSRLAMGSVTERVLSATVTPALIIRPAAILAHHHTEPATASAKGASTFNAPLF